MTLALHGHHMLLIATLIFMVAVLTPNWYSNWEQGININVFQVCINSSTSRTCEWVLSLGLHNSSFAGIKTVYPVLTASFSITCVVISLIGLIVGSWYLEEHTNDNSAKWLLVITIIASIGGFLFSCGVWATMLTTNIQQKTFNISAIHVDDFGFSFWINIGSSSVYLYALLIYLITIYKI